MNNNTPHNLRIDPSAIAQACMIALLITLTGTVLQLGQDVALLKDQLNNFVISKEFAAFKAITEQHDESYEKRLGNIERQLEHRK